MMEFLKSTGFISPYGNMGTDLSSVMAWLFTLLFIYGWYVAKKGKGQHHHFVTLWGMIAMLGYFTVYYLARGLGALATEGKEGFGGPEWIYDFIFLPLLNIHIIVVSIGLVMAIYMIILGFRSSFKKDKERYLSAETLIMNPKTVQKVILGAAIVAFGVAIVRWGPIQRFVVYLAAFLLVVIVIWMEKGLEKWIPDGGKRHRKIGAFTMSLYVIALITSTATYILLYFIYPVKEIAS